MLEYKKISAAIKSEEKKIQIKHERRENALAEISATIELNEKEAILAKLKERRIWKILMSLQNWKRKCLGRLLIASYHNTLPSHII